MELMGPKSTGYYLPHVDLQQLLDVLSAASYQVIGPIVKDGAIVYDQINSVEQLPQGYQDEQAPGSYRLRHTSSSNFFSWSNGVQALKPLTFKPREVLWKAVRNAEGHIEFNEVLPQKKKRAVLGVRACDIAAMQIQDDVFSHGEHRDPYYASRRENLLLIAVNCHYPAATCFCVSTGDGPQVTQGFDIALTELASGFILHTGSEVGADIVDALNLSEPTDAQYYEAGNLALEAEQRQRRTLDPEQVKAQLFQKLEHERWDDIAERCLSCGNCTMVCPTCFCHSETDQSDLQGDKVEYHRQWDSCFTQGHSYIHGMTVRKETKLRYRQWLTHKFSAWYEQFGRSGCVGCGRCISWCPVGIDITEELKLLCAESDA